MKDAARMDLGLRLRLGTYQGDCGMGYTDGPSPRLRGRSRFGAAKARPSPFGRGEGCEGGEGGFGWGLSVSARNAAKATGNPF